MPTGDPHSHRAKVEAKLGGKLTETQWRRTLARAWTPAHSDTPDLAVKDLYVEAMALLREQPAQSTRVVEEEHSDPRFDALARIFERKAAKHSAVARWRSRYLPACAAGSPRLLEPGEVDDFVCAQYWRDMQPSKSVPVVRPGPPFRWRTPDGELGGFARTDRGGLAELAEIADELRVSVRWPQEEAVYFVLTGLAPPRVYRIYAEVLIGESMATTSIQLDVDPRTPGEAVKKMYEQAQRQVSPVKEGAPTRSHPVSERRAALALFLEERPRSSWRELLLAWNDQHPQWNFGGNVPNFAREAKRAREAVVGPFPKSPSPSPNMAERAALVAP